MKAFVDFTEMWVGDVSVDLSGANIGVSQQGLNGTKIGSIH